MKWPWYPHGQTHGIGAYAGDGENCFSKNTDMEFRCIQYVGSPGESVCLDKDWAGLFEFQMQQKSDDVRRYGIVCLKAAVLKAFLILLR